MSQYLRFDKVCDNTIREDREFRIISVAPMFRTKEKNSWQRKVFQTSYEIQFENIWHRIHVYVSEAQRMTKSVGGSEELLFHVFVVLFVGENTANNDFVIIYDIASKVVKRVILSGNGTHFCRNALINGIRFRHLFAFIRKFSIY